MKKADEELLAERPEVVGEPVQQDADGEEEAGDENRRNQGEDVVVQEGREGDDHLRRHRQLPREADEELGETRDDVGHQQDHQSEPQG